MRRGASLLVLSALLLGACGDGGTASEAEGGGFDPSALDRVVTTVSGDDLDLAGYADRDLVLWFWAPW